MLALLVRAHKTDTNAWYPVATSQPRASAVRRQHHSINAHQQCREEEQLRAASKSANFREGKGMKQWERWDEHEEMQANQMQVKKGSCSCGGRNGNPKTGRDEMP
jgi:hypothetical protein